MNKHKHAVLVQSEFFSVFSCFRQSKKNNTDLFCALQNAESQPTKLDRSRWSFHWACLCACDLSIFTHKKKEETPCWQFYRDSLNSSKWCLSHTREVHLPLNYTSPSNCLSNYNVQKIHSNYSRCIGGVLLLLLLKSVRLGTRGENLNAVKCMKIVCILYMFRYQFTYD